AIGAHRPVLAVGDDLVFARHLADLAEGAEGAPAAARDGGTQAMASPRDAIVLKVIASLDVITRPWNAVIIVWNERISKSAPRWRRRVSCVSRNSSSPWMRM